MNDAMRMFVVMQAIAIYTELGLVSAVVHLKDNGFTQEESVDVIAMYDGYVEQVKAGQLGVTLH
jgi:hypothetical protein